jgi:hypothetical protein
VYTFVSCELCAAYAVCAVATEPDITAAIARAIPILRIRFLPGVCEIAMRTSHANNTLHVRGRLTKSKEFGESCPSKMTYRYFADESKYVYPLGVAVQPGRPATAV